MAVGGALLKKLLGKKIVDVEEFFQMVNGKEFARLVPTETSASDSSASMSPPVLGDLLMEDVKFTP